MYNKRITFYIVFFMIIGSAQVCADVIVMENGDRISGTIVSAAEGHIVIDSDYVGPLTLPLAAVSTLETVEKRTAALADGNVLEGAFVVRSGELGLASEDGWHPVKTSDLLLVADTLDALEVLKTPAAPKRWGGAVEAGAALRSGQTETTDLKFSAAFTRTGDRDILTLGVASSYGAADGAINTRKYSGDFRWQYYLRERLYLYTLGLAERDDGRKLELRLQGGGGLGYDFIKRERTTLSADLGLTYTHERWAPFTPWDRDKVTKEKRNGAYNRLYAALPNLLSESSFSQNAVNEMREILADIRDPLRTYSRKGEEYMNLRVGMLFSQVVFRESKVTENLTIMPNLEQLGEFRATSELALISPLTKALSLRTSLKSEYDSLSRNKEIDPWDHTLMTQFTYSF